MLKYLESILEMKSVDCHVLYSSHCSVRPTWLRSSLFLRQSMMLSEAASWSQLSTRMVQQKLFTAMIALSSRLLPPPHSNQWDVLIVLRASRPDQAGAGTSTSTSTFYLPPTACNNNNGISYLIPLLSPPFNHRSSTPRCVLSELSRANQSQVSVYTIYIPSVNTLQTHLFANNVVIISLWKIYLPPAGRMGLFAKKIPGMVFVQPWLVGYRLEFYFLRTGYFSPASLRHGDVAFIC